MLPAQTLFVMDKIIEGLWTFLSGLLILLNRYVPVLSVVAFCAVGAYLIVQTVTLSVKLLKVVKIQKTFGLMEVEANVESLTVSRWKKLLFRYEMQLKYSVYGREFSKTLILFNKKLPTDSAVDLKFPPFRPESAVLKDGSEGRELAYLIFINVMAVLAAFIVTTLLAFVISLAASGLHTLIGRVLYFIYWALCGKVLPGTDL